MIVMKELKNVITINDFNYSQGGASKVAIDTANMIAEQGLNSIFISAVSDNCRSTLDSGVIQYEFNGQEFLRFSNKISGMINGLKCKKFSKYVENVLENFDSNETVIHVHGWTKACSSDFFKVLKKKGYKTFLTLHEYFSFCCTGAYFNYKKNVACTKKGCGVGCLLCNCDSRNYIFKLYRYIRELYYKKDIDFKFVHAIFISEFEKNIIEKQFKCSKSTIIKNPISKLVISKKSKEYDFLYIGRTSKEKGIELFVELASRLKDKKFLIVGNYNSNLKNLNSTGWISEREVDDYLLKSKVLVFPSLWPETFGLNIVKALDAGIPCLVSSNTAAEYYVNNGIDGLIFKQGSIDDLTEKALIIEKLNPAPKKTNNEDYIQKLIGTYIHEN